MASLSSLRKSEQIAKEWGERDAHEWLRSREAAAERTKDMTFEARVFTERKGIPIHWTVSGEDINALEGNVSDLLEWLDVNEFAPHAGFGVKPEAAAKPQQRAQQARPQQAKPQRAARVVCEYCGGEVWDNRQKKASGQFSERSPDYTCKDRDGCGGAAWIRDDGELSWKAA